MLGRERSVGKSVTLLLTGGRGTSFRPCSFPSLCVPGLLLAVLLGGCATRTPAPPPAVSERRAQSSHPTPTALPPMPEGGYTWQHLVAHAVAANPDHAAILAEAHAEYLRYKSKTDLQDPRLTLDYTDRDADDDRYGGAIRLYTPNPFVNRHLLRTGEAARRETEAGAEMLKREIALTVYELVQEVLSEERMLAVLRERERVLSDWAAHMKTRLDAHVATQADVLSIDLQRLRLKASIQQRRLAAQTARRSLQALTQIPGGQLTLDPTPPDWQAVLDTFEDERALVETAFSCSAELAAAQAAYEKARATLDTAKARQIPWFSFVQAGYTTRDSSDANDLRLRLALNIPLFAWMNSETKMATAQMDAATLRAEGIRQRVRSELAGRLADLRETIELWGDYRAALDSLPEPVREAIPDAETFYKLSDTRLSASEYLHQTELRCALIYGQLLSIAGGM